MNANIAYGGWQSPFNNKVKTQGHYNRVKDFEAKTTLNTTSHQNDLNVIIANSHHLTRRQLDEVYIMHYTRGPAAANERKKMDSNTHTTKP